jgi:hypothetical protein
MGLFVLSETSAGLALFKAKDKKILKISEEAQIQTAQGINDLQVQLLSRITVY